MGNVVEKWDFTYRALKHLNPSTEAGEQEDFALTRCGSFDELTPLDEDDNLKAEAFADTLNESCEKIIFHGLNIAKALLVVGEVKTLAAVLGSIVLARNQLVFYQSDALDSVKEPIKVQTAEGEEPVKKYPSVKKSISELNDLADAISTQLQQYHCQLVFTTVLHDAESQDWTETTKTYFEGDRISIPIQFWGFHMQGLRSDLYNSLPPSMARATFAKVFDDSLGVLVARYCQVSEAQCAC